MFFFQFEVTLLSEMFDTDKTNEKIFMNYCTATSFILQTLMINPLCTCGVAYLMLGAIKDSIFLCQNTNTRRLN